MGRTNKPELAVPAGATPLSLTLVILTHNEEQHLPRAIASVSAMAERIIVVDSGSVDATISLAKQAGAEVFHRKWVNYADQFQWALEHTNITSEWIMRLDADEWLGPDLVQKIRMAIPNINAAVTGISLDRRHYFLGRWIKHGGRYPLKLLRIWRRGAGRIEQRWMDEHIVLSHGDIAHFKGEFVDENLHGIGFFTTKHNSYAAREAVDVLIAKYRLEECGARQELTSTRQAERKRSVKSSIYNHLPIGVGPLGYFLYRYFLQLGFLDGRAGLIYHVLQGFWYRFLVDAKRTEFEHAMAGIQGRDARIDALEKTSGLDIRAFMTSIADGE